MESMHDSNTSLLAPAPEIVVCGFSEEEEKSLSGTLTSSVVALDYKNVMQPGFASSIENAQVLVISVPGGDTAPLIANLKICREKFPTLVIVVVSSQLELLEVDQFINEVQVFSILEPGSDLSATVVQATQDFDEKARRLQSLRQVRSQNKQLESLNQNLEKLVHERTLKEYDAHQRALSSLRNIQNILTFIKNISKSETIGDLMNQVRGEFKGFHGLMPPVLLLSSAHREELRVFYFQGKQFVEKRISQPGDVSVFRSSDDAAIRRDLSHFLGRPYGTITTHELSFQSSELDRNKALLVFEHSLDTESYSDFQAFSKERWSMLNMALENILLKERLQFISRQWSKTFNEMKDPIVIVDENMKVTLANSYFNDLRTELKASFENGLEPFGSLAIVQEAFAKGESQTLNISLVGRVYQVHSYPIRLEERDMVTHVINQFIDVTQSIDLQTKVVQGEKMAAVGLLAGNIAHELNNPLTGIFSLSQLLLEDFESDTNTFKDLSEIKGAAARCQTIIRDLLDFSSVGGDSKNEKIDINGLVAKTLPLLKMAMRTLNSDIDLHPAPLYVLGNPQLLQQVVFNLVNNACQAMEDGGRLSVIVRPKGSCVEVVVRDTGPGIPEEIQATVFDPFFTTKKEGEGTGLGLSMSRSVVKRHNGQLSLNRNYKQGTEFIVELPTVEI